MAPDTGLLDSYGAEAALATDTHFYFSPNSQFQDLKLPRL